MHTLESLFILSEILQIRDKIPGFPIYSKLSNEYLIGWGEWGCGRAMVLGRRPTILITLVGQGPPVFVGVGGCLDIFLTYHFFFFLPLSGRRLNIV